MNLEELNKKSYYPILRELNESIDDYVLRCKNKDLNSKHYPSPNNVVNCINNLMSQNTDDNSYSEVVIQILCNKIISNSMSIRGIDSEKIFKAIDFNKIKQDDIIYLATEIINKTREDIFPYSLNSAFKIIKDYLPINVVSDYQKVYEYGISEEGKKAYEKKFISPNGSLYGTGTADNSDANDGFYVFGSLICMIIALTIIFKCFEDISFGEQILYFALGIGLGVLGVFLFSKVSQKTIDMANSSNSSKKSSHLYKSSNIPKCPTCGSTNVHPISDGKKAMGFLMMGVFSKNFGKSYECDNCKYRW